VLPFLPLVIRRKLQCNWRSTNGKCDDENVVGTMNEFIEVATMIRYLLRGLHFIVVEVLAMGNSQGCHK
jgi:hypothetical protein